MFADADAVMVVPLSDFSLFIDIFRRKPHLPDLADVLAVMPGAPGAARRNGCDEEALSACA